MAATGTSSGKEGISLNRASEAMPERDVASWVPTEGSCFSGGLLIEHNE